MKNILVPLLLLPAFASGLAGCASNLSGESYSRSEARSVQQVEYGTVGQLRPVQIEGTKTPIGAGAGAIAGGIAGSGVGSGKGRSVMAVVGALAGGLVGAAAEEGVTRTQGVEITVNMNSGRSVAIVQKLSPNERFNVGDRVRVISSGQTARVSH